MSAVLVRYARKSYGRMPVLDDVSLEVPAGSITAVLGASGSGKTTLLRSIAGFERLDAGAIAIGDRVVDDGSKWTHAQHRGVGYVPQDGGLFPHLRVRANIAFGLRRRDSCRVAGLVSMLGLDGLDNRFPHQLSGGQRQRVALARALAPRPALVLLDEPFASLDAGLRVHLRRYVAQVLRDVGATAIVVTHDRDEAFTMADQIAVLRNGRIAGVGSPRQLYNSPSDEHVAQFLGTANLLPGEVVAGELQCAVPLQERLGFDDGAYTVLLRPEHLTVALEPTDGAEASVTAVAYHGATTALTLRRDGEPTSELVAEVPGDVDIAVGQRVWVSASRCDVAWPVR
ncbi:ABC transporter ATP-binding protein [Mycolicibacterium sarraceniae]|uniref:ABC-type quaternary amine transporter n=1 Tax=Mycolicibacterium sarraceniae TaxID=1534348 RepID=A0A7I7SVP4_9MYCO|nr:ABC transporter ATP-binding protein [Mycolicibacterium sarraceniae]BBY59916.1 Fe(3+) ions import ATP-binding protein FbpC [Mycolicibacterium sarraceniae]